MTNKHLAILTCLAVFLPQTALAARIDILDSVAGLGTEVTVTELAPNEVTNLSLHTPSGSTSSYTLNANDVGIASTWIAGADIQYAGEYQVRVNDTSTTLTVLSDTVDAARSRVQPVSPATDINQPVLVEVQFRDRYGNPLQGRSAQLLSSRDTDFVETITSESDSTGTQLFRFTATKAGTATLRAIDLLSGSAINSSAIITVAAVGGPTTTAYTYTQSAPQQFYPSANRYGANLLNGSALTGQASGFQELAGFEINISRQENVATPNLRASEAESMTVMALDQNGDRYFDYEGTVYLFSTDPEAELPKDGVIDFSFRDQGMKQFTLGLIFNTPGEQQLVISPSADAVTDILATLNINVEGQTQRPPDPDQNIAIRSPTQGQVLSSSEVIVEGSGPPFINITVSGGTEDVIGETDIQGNFAIPITLDDTQTNFTISVEDRDGRYASEERSFSIDVTPPEITSIKLTPENPEEEEDVLLVISTNDDVRDISATFDGEPIELISNESGKYQHLLTAPEAGVYTIEVEASDAYGNTVTDSASLAVALRGLPKVQNVIATPEINQISLRWDPMQDQEIDAYRIYVGTEPDEFLYTLDTDRPTAAATVAGLQPGSTYYFAVTALQDERESEAQSDTVDATVLGVRLSVSPGDSSLLIDFNSLQQNVPLSSFILEYGADPEELTERRTLNGELRAYTLRDLINGVTYYLKLTPVAVTGERLEDLAADGQGTPIGAGFSVSPSDPVPYELRAAAPTVPTDPAPVTPTPPTTSDTGLSSTMLLMVVLLSAGIFGWYIHHRKSQQQTIAFMQSMQARYHE